MVLGRPSTVAGFDRIVEQQAITAPRHLDTVRDQAAGLVLARVVLEILLGASKAKQDFGDGALAVFSRLRRRHLIESKASQPYRISYLGRRSLRAQPDNR